MQTLTQYLFKKIWLYNYFCVRFPSFQTLVFVCQDMWKRVHVVSLRICSKDLQKTWSAWGYRLCSSAHPPASSNKPSTQPRTQAEKAKRRREKEKAILSSVGYVYLQQYTFNWFYSVRLSNIILFIPPMQDVNDVVPVWSEKEKIRYTAALLPGEKKGIKID